MSTLSSPVQVEPLPGYRLLERLGVGGFGEVWKAEAPGGVLKAIKIVQGGNSPFGDDENAGRELKGLERIKALRHPYLLAMDRYDVVDGRLLIVMELADGTLWDHAKAYHAQGLPGIPREELLRYLDEAAEALDLMNSRFQLQHLDIKPQNLFLVCHHVKVGDFGLVKALEGMQADRTGGLTAGYSAPEVFDGQVSHFCDQYSLAIVYQELLTGQRPFGGTSPRQMMLQHMTATPNLTLLPERDRAVVARALAKKPDERFPSCGAFVQALRGEPATTSAGSSALRRTLANVDPDRTTRVGPPVRARPAPPRHGDLVPTVIVGIGGVGGAVLQQLTPLLSPVSGGALPHVRLLHLDTDASPEQGLLHTPLRRLSHYLRDDPSRPPVTTWLPHAALRTVRHGQASAAGRRCLGRLALVDHYDAVRQRLTAELRACANPIALTTTTRRTGLAFRTEQPRVVLVANLAGGTGSGMFLDLAYLARQLLREFGPDAPEVNALLLLPETADANTVAALTELNHYSDPRTTFTAWHRESDEPLDDPAAPFQRCLLLPLTPATPALAANLLALDAATALGTAIEKRRPSLVDGAGSFQTAGLYRLTMPRKALLHRVARTLYASLVQTAAPGPEIAAWAAAWWQRGNLASTALAATLTAAGERALGGPAEAAFERMSLTLHDPHDAAQVRQVLAHLERWVGAEPTQGSELALLEDVLERETALLKESLPQRLAERLQAAQGTLLFQPADVGPAFLQAVRAACEEGVRQQEQLYAEQSQEAARVRARILAAVARLQGGRWWPRRKERQAATLADDLRHYARLRFHTLVAQRVSQLVQGVQRLLLHHSADFGCCQRRLALFLKRAEEVLPAVTAELDPVVGQLLLPVDDASLPAAAARVLASIAPADHAALRQRVYALVGNQLNARSHLCTLADADFATLMRQLYQQVLTVVDRQLAWTDAADFYLAGSGTEATTRADLAGLFAAARPTLEEATPTLNLIAVPTGPAGNQLSAHAQAELPGATVLSLPTTDDIVFYREAAPLALHALPHLDPAALEAYHAQAHDPAHPCHSRLDVIDWLPCENPCSV